MTTNPKVDPEFAALIPPLTTEERAGLEEALAREGCRDALVVWRGTLLDGHNRLEICTRRGIEYRTVEVTGVEDRVDAECWIIRNQFGRRNLTSYTRGRLALALEERLAVQAKARQAAAGGDKRSAAAKVGAGSVVQNSAQAVDRTRDAVAAAAGVSHATTDAVKLVEKHGTKELKAAAESGKVAPSAAAEIARLPAEKQREVLEAGTTKAVAKAVREERTNERRKERVERLVEISRGDEPLSAPSRHPVIYADPPWRYEHAESESRAIENKYPTMTLEEICALPVGDVTTDDCVLFMWATSPKLAESMQVVTSWGFTYRTCAVWVKDKIGMGYYFRQQHELLLVATKGKPPTPAPGNRPPSVVASPRGEHSAKPEMVYDIIEAMYPEFSKLEMFCRKARPGWSVWGNQS